MPKRVPFSKEQERFELKERHLGNPDVEKRYGVKLWKKVALEGLTNHSATAMKKHLLIPRMKERHEVAPGERRNSRNEYVEGDQSIVRLLNYFVDGKYMHLIMEYLRGGSLADKLEKYTFQLQCVAISAQQSYYSQRSEAGQSAAQEGRRFEAGQLWAGGSCDGEMGIDRVWNTRIESSQSRNWTNMHRKEADVWSTGIVIHDFLSKF